MMGPLLIIIAAVLWALDGLLRRNVYTLPPLTIVTLEHLIGLLFLLPTLWLNRQTLRTLKPTTWSTLGLVSLLSGLVGTLLFTAALLQVNFIPMSIVFLLQKLQPIFVFLTAVVVLKERITLSQIGWSAVALIAGFFMTFPGGQWALSGNTTLAALMALGAAAAWGISTVFSRWLLLRLNANLTTALRFLLTSGLGLVALWIFPSQQTLSQVTPAQYLNILAIAVSTGMVALVIYYQGLKRTNATTATILELFFPALAVVIDALVYKVTLAPTQYLAALGLLLAVWQIAKRNQQLLTTQFNSLQVVGDGRGKKLGYPTINLAIPKNLDLAYGIYAARISFLNQTYQGALHYGPVPTFDKTTPTLEIFLLDTTTVPTTVLKQQTMVSVEIVARLREIQKFSQKEALVSQISQDVTAVKTILSQTS